MPTKKKLLTIVLDDVTYNALADFRFNNRIKSESKAGLQILLAGMNAMKDEYPELDLSTKLETGKKQKMDGVVSANL